MKLDLKVNSPANYIPERRYIFDVLFKEFLGLDYHLELWAEPNVCVSLMNGSDGKEVILLDGLFQTPESDWLTARALPKCPLRVWHVPDSLADLPLVSQQLPVIYGRTLDAHLRSYYNEFEGGVTLGLDIFGSAFFMLSRYEELVKPERDEHNRFPSHASLAFREGFLKRPIINEYLEILWGILHRMWPELQRKHRDYRVLPSHDVDVPLFTLETNSYRVLRSTTADILLRKDLSLAKQRLGAYVESWHGVYDGDPNNTFDFIMDTEEQYGWQSSFYFICGDSPNDGTRYGIDHPWLRTLLCHIHQRGHMIGLHPSYDTYKDEQKTKEEFQRLLSVTTLEGIQQDNWGGRQHYLRWENPITWRNWEKAGLAYDSTLGFAEEPGFRSGLCYEYTVYDLSTRQHLNLRERPLVVMDGALFDSPYFPAKDLSNEVIKLSDVCRAFSGDLTLLWHNNCLISKQQRQLYCKICDCL